MAALTKDIDLECRGILSLRLSSLELVNAQVAGNKT